MDAITLKLLKSYLLLQSDISNTEFVRLENTLPKHTAVSYFSTEQISTYATIQFHRGRCRAFNEVLQALGHELLDEYTPAPDPA